MPPAGRRRGGGGSPTATPRPPPAPRAGRSADSWCGEAPPPTSRSGSATPQPAAQTWSGTSTAVADGHSRLRRDGPHAGARIAVLEEGIRRRVDDLVAGALGGGGTCHTYVPAYLGLGPSVGPGASCLSHSSRSAEGALL